MTPRFHQRLWVCIVWLWRRCLAVIDWHARAVVWTAAGVMLIAAASLAWLNWWFFPHLPDYRPRVEAEISSKIGLPVTVGHIEGGWRGIQPYLMFREVKVLDKSGHVALNLNEAEGTLSWWPLFIGDLRFDALIANQPTLEVTRDRQGILRLAGLTLNKGQNTDDGFANWVLRQHEIGVRQGRLIWRDEMRDAPPLTLDKVDFSLQNLLFGQHRVHLEVTPQADLAAPFSVEGDWRGDDLDTFASWKGSLQGNFGELDLARAGIWLPYPIEVKQGHGRLDFRIEFRGATPLLFNADLAIDKASLRLAPELALLELDALSGRLHWQDDNGERKLTLNELKLSADGGKLIEAGSAKLRLLRGGGGDVSMSSLTLPALANLPPALPLPNEVRQALSGVKPFGKIDSLEANWRGDWREPTGFDAAIGFHGIGINAPAPWPTVGPLDGNVSVTEKGGTFKIQSPPVAKKAPQTPFSLTADGIFEKALQFEHLAAQGSWQHDAKHWQFNLQDFSARNADVAAQARGKWQWNGEGSGTIDLTAEIGHLAATHLTDYMPLGIGPETRAWLKKGLTSGEARDARFIVKGPLDKFPWADGKSGIWKVVTGARGVTLDYGVGWPKVEKLDGEVRMTGNRLEIDGAGNILGTKVEHANALIEDVLHSNNIVIKGDVSGQTMAFFRFINESPLDRNLQGIAHDAKADGDGRLALKLDIPLDNADNTKVDGVYRFQKNRISLTPAMPEVADLRGELHFTENGIDAKGLLGNALGGTAKVDLATLRDGTVRISANGRAETRLAAQRYAVPMAEALSGNTDFRLELDLPRLGGWQLALEALLKDTRIDLPAPLGKPLGELRPLRMAIETTANAERWRVAVGKTGAAEVRRVPVGDNWKIERADIRLGDATASASRSGIWLTANLPELDIEAWQARMADFAGDASNKSGNTLALDGIDGKIGRLLVSGYRLDDVVAHAVSSAGQWQINMNSKQANGNVQWSPQGRGRVAGRLSRLQLPLPSASASPVAPSGNVESPKLPAVDLIIDDFQFRNHPLGRLDVKAQPQRENWLIDKVSIVNPDGQLGMEGIWRSVGNDQFTSVKIDVDSPNVGKLLERFGYAEAMRRGSGKLWGEVNWNGTPMSPDFATLSGNLKLKAENGQFAKIEPGVGRLLGILSLQALPRRISLDFRDVFSEGFSFDLIEGDSKIVRGVISTDNLHIIGTAAQILFRGEANVANETQNLRVRIVPTLGDGIAVGAGVALANPLLGVGAFLLQRVFKDPLGRLVAYEYDITGKWDDPKVEKVVQVNANTRKLN